MVYAYHVIITTYGFWLPNDPRGSWSDWVRQWEILAFGAATKVETRRSLASSPHDRTRRFEAKRSLRYPEVELNGRQALAVGQGFHRAATESGYVVHACSILPRHAHLVIARSDRRAEQMVAHLKGRATQRLLAEESHPFAGYLQSDGTTPSPWTRKSWRVFLDSEQRILSAVDYVEKNPVREGKPPQRWSFVTPYIPKSRSRSP